MSGSVKLNTLNFDRMNIFFKMLLTFVLVLAFIFIDAELITEFFKRTFQNYLNCVLRFKRCFEEFLSLTTYILILFLLKSYFDVLLLIDSTDGIRKSVWMRYHPINICFDNSINIFNETEIQMLLFDFEYFNIIL